MHKHFFFNKKMYRIVEEEEKESKYKHFYNIIHLQSCGYYCVDEYLNNFICLPSRTLKLEQALIIV